MKNQHSFTVRCPSQNHPGEKTAYISNRGVFFTKQTCHAENVALLKLRKQMAWKNRETRIKWLFRMFFFLIYKYRFQVSLWVQ